MKGYGRTKAQRREHMRSYQADRYADKKLDPTWVEEKNRRARVNRLRREYGLTPEAVDQMYTKQGGLCAICATPLTDRYHIDHDHESKIVRGLLCGWCNRAIGQLRESPAVLRRAADYLEGMP